MTCAVSRAKYLAPTHSAHPSTSKAASTALWRAKLNLIAFTPLVEAPSSLAHHSAPCGAGSACASEHRSTLTCGKNLVAGLMVQGGEQKCTKTANSNEGHISSFIRTIIVEMSSLKPFFTLSLWTLCYPLFDSFFPFSWWQCLWFHGHLVGNLACNNLFTDPLLNTFCLLVAFLKLPTFPNPVGKNSWNFDLGACC